MSDKYLVAIGANCIDEYYELNEIPKMGDKVVTKLSRKTVGGMIGNAASVYANYGNKTYMLDYLNDEDDANIILDNLKKNGINIDYITKEKLEYNSRCLIMLYQGERIIYVQENPKKNIVVDQTRRELLLNSMYIYTTVSDLKRYANTLEFVNDITSRKSMIALDVEANTITDISSDIEILKKATILFINDSGDVRLKELINEDYYNELLTANVRFIVLTLGDKGCRVITKEEQISINGLKIIVKDTTGAGDTFNASFLHGLTRGWSIKQTAEFANAAAANSVQYIGPKSGVVDEQEVLRFMKNI